MKYDRSIGVCWKAQDSHFKASNKICILTKLQSQSCYGVFANIRIVFCFLTNIRVIRNTPRILHLLLELLRIVITLNKNGFSFLQVRFTGIDLYKL